MNSPTPFRERRSSARLRETPLRRRNGNVRWAYLRSNPSGVPTNLERRKHTDERFNVAATLELNLDRFPTQAAMLTFVTSVLQSAEAGEIGSRQADYVAALRQAVDLLAHSPAPIEAVATLYGYQAYTARHAPGIQGSSAEHRWV